MDSNNKKILVIPETKVEKSQDKKVKSQKEKVKRQVTETNRWTKFADLLGDTQTRIISNLYNNCVADEEKELATIISQQIGHKIYGYKAQDLEKGLYCAEKFVDFPKILEMFADCSMACFYCKNPVLVLYEYVREPKQWTVERIDNHFGHNKDNIAIACLNCNLHRRTMYHERYMFTKNLNIVKKNA